MRASVWCVLDLEPRSPHRITLIALWQKEPAHPWGERQVVTSQGHSACRVVVWPVPRSCDVVSVVCEPLGRRHWNNEAPRDDTTDVVERLLEMRTTIGQARRRIEHAAWLHVADRAEGNFCDAAQTQRAVPPRERHDLPARREQYRPEALDVILIADLMIDMPEVQEPAASAHD